MIDFGRMKTSRAVLATGAAVLVALGAAAGAGAVQTTRPAVEMAPTVATPIAKLASSSGVVTVKGRVAEVYGDRFVVQDQSGRAMIAAGREARGTVSVGQPILVQGRYDDGQLRASYLVDRNGSVAAVGPRAGSPDGPGRHGPRGGPGREGPPPPPPGCAPAPGGPGGPGAVPPPPPAGGDAPVAGRAAPPPPGAPQAPPIATPPGVGSTTPRS